MLGKIKRPVLNVLMVLENRTNIAAGTHPHILDEVSQTAETLVQPF